MRTYDSKAGIPEGFNMERIRALRLRSSLFRIARLLALCAVLAFVGYLMLDFLSRAPRERRLARSSFWERVANGASINSAIAWNWLTAEHDDPKGTSLPVLELFIRRQKLEALSEHLPQSGRIFQPGIFKARQKGSRDVVLPALLRFRGDSLNHWAFPEKSWRVKLKHGARYLGMRQFNLYLPRSRSQIPDFLGYNMAERMGGLVVPKAFPVHLRVNREFSGLRVFLEQVNEDFFVNHAISADRLFVGDIDFNELYGRVSRHQLFESASGWEIQQVAKGVKAGDSEIKSLVAALQIADGDPVAFKTAIEAVVDVPSVLRYMAYLEVVGSIHVDETHNQRFFYDTEMKRLRPIVWDPVAYYWDSAEVLRGVDFGKNRMFRALLMIPEYRNTKNRFIWEAINGPLSKESIDRMIREGADSIRREVMASPQGVFTDSASIGVLPHTEWEESVQSLIQRSAERNLFLRRALEKSSVSPCAQSSGTNYTLMVQVGGDAGVRLESLTLVPKTEEQRDVRVVIKGRSGESVITAPYKAQLGGYVVPFREILFSTRSYDTHDDVVRKSSTHLYEIKVQGPPVSLGELRGRNTITDEPVSFSVKEGGCGN